MIGGRSGNRGRCAQPCRLPYEVMAHGKNITSSDERYLLSPKDLCTLRLLPDILEAGVYSLKIEGRMKKPEYVASVTAMYRKYVDRYLAHGREDYQVEEEDVCKLMDIYNRGGFTDGYYNRHNGRDMMSLRRPNHCGVAVGKIVSIGKNTLDIEFSMPLQKGDVLEFDTKSQSPDYTLGQDMAAGSRFTIKNRFQNGRCLQEKELRSKVVSRIRNQSLIAEITNRYLDKDLKVPITGSAKLEAGKPARLTLTCGDTSVTCKGAEVSLAKNRPMTAEEIREKLDKTGGTDFAITSLTVECEENIFIPVGMLNELRRTAFSELKNALLCPFSRTCEKNENSFQSQTPNAENDTAVVSVLVSTQEQFFACCSLKMVEQIILEKELFELPKLQEMIALGCQNGKQMFLAMPYIFRGRAYEEWKEHDELWDSEMISGFLIRNLEEYFYLTAEEQKFPFRNKMLLFDEGIYCNNSESGAYLNSLHPQRITYPKELKISELRNLSVSNGELVVYGYPAVMVTAGCIKKNMGRCDHKTEVGEYELLDRTKERMKVMNVCSQCYNVIYYKQPVNFLDEAQEVTKLHPTAVRLHFTFEDAKKTEEILNQFTRTLLPACREFGRGVY
jgi:putative protease